MATVTKRDLLVRAFGLDDDSLGLVPEDPEFTEKRDDFDAICEQIMKAVEDGDRVELRGFCVFEPQKRAGRQVRNPRTGEALWMPPHISPRVRPGSVFTDRVRGEVSARPLSERVP